MSTMEEIARAYWKAEESRDLDRIVAFFAADAEWNGPGVHLRGRDEIRSFYATSAAAFPQLEVEIGRVMGGEREAAIEWSAIFGDPAGNRRDLAGVNLMRTDGEQILSLTTYHDPSTLVAPRVTSIAIAQRFARRRVLVTGAGGGIGAATARQFLSEGAFVTGVDIDGDLLAGQVTELGELAAGFTPIVADITDSAAQTEIVASACGPDGALDVLVNNAAVFLMAGLDATEEQWRRTLDVNLLAPAQLVAAAADALGRSAHAAVVNIASISGHVAQANRWTYNASKGGLLELTRCQALDLAPRGVRVNSISPGFIWTDVLDRGADHDRPRWEKVWGAFCLQHRCAEPFEVATAVAFLASDAASFVTGTDLAVDGGLLATSAEGTAAFEFSS